MEKNNVEGNLLHWVFKSSNLKADVLDLYCGKLGMRVLRHEEFSSGCDAQCNGPYARPWSKTMIGYGEEKNNFVLELAFNYGIRHYEEGNGFRHIIINDQKNSPNGFKTIDGYLIKIQSISKSLPSPSIVGVSFNVSDLERSKCS
jgi:hypothetical protein